MNVFGQSDNINFSNLDRNLTDSLTTIIDIANPSIKKLDFTISFDSLIGEQIMTIEKQTFKTFCKYTLKTDKTGTRMDVKIIELYLYNDNLIKATVYYHLYKLDFWKMFYFKDDKYFSMVVSPRGIRISLEENGEEYVLIANKLTKFESDN